MIEPADILEELEFWKSVQTRMAALGLQTDGVMDTVVDAMVKVFYDALYGNGGVMWSEDDCKKHLAVAEKVYGVLRKMQCCELDAVFFYKARAIYWATATIAGLDPSEFIDGLQVLPEDMPADGVTDITTEIV